MKLLLDSCLSPRDREALEQAGYDVRWCGDWPADPGDPEILRRAYADRRVLVTLDKGFGRLAFEQRMPHAGIVWLRNVSPLIYVDLIVRAVETFGAALQTGAMVVVGLDGMRTRRSAFDDAEPA